MKNIFSKAQKKRCCQCDERKEVAHCELKQISHNQFVPQYWCEDCNNIRQEVMKRIEEAQREEDKKRKKEEYEKQRLQYLKQEIERIEIERKAKEYGITYPPNSLDT